MPDSDARPPDCPKGSVDGRLAGLEEKSSRIVRPGSIVQAERGDRSNPREPLYGLPCST
jgi:hypothetical protein